MAARIRAVASPHRITLSYGYHAGYPLNNGHHRGTDYVSDDRKVIAPQAGKVTVVGYDKVNGNHVAVEGGGYRDWFAHLKAGTTQVAVGQSVAQGQLIGVMGMTGTATGVHLHHGLRKDGVLVDPEKHVTQGVIDMYEGKTAEQWARLANEWHQIADDRQKLVNPSNEDVIQLTNKWLGRNPSDGERNQFTSQRWRIFTAWLLENAKTSDADPKATALVAAINAIVQ